MQSLKQLLPSFLIGILVGGIASFLAWQTKQFISPPGSSNFTTQSVQGVTEIDANRIVYLAFTQETSTENIQQVFTQYIDHHGIINKENLGGLGSTKIKNANQRLTIRDWSKSFVLEFAPSDVLEQLIQDLRLIPGVEVVEFGLPVELMGVNDPLLNEQWHLKNINFDNIYDSINASCIQLDSKKIQVGIIDQGFETHSDLFSNLGNVKISGFEIPHATRMMGIIGAVTNNGNGIASLPFNTAIMNGYDLGGNWVAQLSKAIENGDQIINMSFGREDGQLNLSQHKAKYYSQFEQDAINAALEKGAIIVAAAGNNHKSYAAYPALYDGVIGVGALDENGKNASYSNYGEGVDVTVAGNNIYTTSSGDAYEKLNGTSMSAAYFTSLMAFFLALNGANSDQVISYTSDIEGAIKKILIEECGKDIQPSFYCDLDEDTYLSKETISSDPKDVPHVKKEQVGTETKYIYCDASNCKYVTCDETTPGNDCNDNDKGVTIPGTACTSPEGYPGVLDDACTCQTNLWFCDGDLDGHKSKTPYSTDPNVVPHIKETQVGTETKFILCDANECHYVDCAHTPGDDCDDTDKNKVDCEGSGNAGVCGPAHGNAFVDANAVNAAGLCAQGIAVPSTVSGPAPWHRSCHGLQTHQLCEATQKAGRVIGDSVGVTIEYDGQNSQ